MLISQWYNSNILPSGPTGHTRPKISIYPVHLRYWIETRNIPVVEGLYCNSPRQKQTIMRLAVLVILQNWITQHSTSQWVTLRCGVRGWLSSKIPTLTDLAGYRWIVQTPKQSVHKNINKLEGTGAYGPLLIAPAEGLGSPSGPLTCVGNLF